MRNILKHIHPTRLHQIDTAGPATVLAKIHNRTRRRRSIGPRNVEDGAAVLQDIRVLVAADDGRVEHELLVAPGVGFAELRVRVSVGSVSAGADVPLDVLAEPVGAERGESDCGKG